MNELNKWHESVYTDEFGYNNDKKIKSFKTEGNYSNKYVTDKPLSVTIKIKEKHISIFLSNKYLPSLIEIKNGETVSVCAKVKDNDLLKFNFSYNSEGFIEEEGDERFYNLINNGKSEQVKVVVKNSYGDNGIEKYKFSFTTMGQPKE